MITSSPTAPEGSVTFLTTYKPELFTSNSSILCRNTGPLVAFAYSLLKRDVPCYIRGKDIGTSLITIVTKMRATNLLDLRARLDTWHNRELQRLLEEDRDPERLSDQYQCLLFFIASLDENSQTVPDLIAKIELMFDDSTTSSKVCLSTVHKAKGLEWKKVFILDRSLMPSKWAKQPWQKDQEINIEYVAVTRAMEELIFITSDSWETKEG